MRNTTFSNPIQQRKAAIAKRQQLRQLIREQQDDIADRYYFGETGMEYFFVIQPTASCDPALLWAAFNGGPVLATYQWHRIAFRLDEDLDS